MATVSIGKERIAAGWLVFWVAVGGAAIWYLYDALLFAATRDMQPGATVWNRGIWYFAHITMATPILFIGPLQFLAALRQARPEVHRWLGRLFLSGSILGAVMAGWLGGTLELPGSRVPLAFFAAIWCLFSIASWLCARRRDFANHRRFAIRSFAIGLAFVWARLITDASDTMLAFMPSEDLRESTKEWLCFTLPLLTVETWLTWWPQVRGSRRKA